MQERWETETEIRKDSSYGQMGRSPLRWKRLWEKLKDVAVREEEGTRFEG